MKVSSITRGAAGAVLAAAFALPAGAADMTHDRALNVHREPHNWLLHTQNYQGHRYSPLSQINTNNVGNMRLAFITALSGFQSGGRYPHGNLEGTPIVEDGMMYVTDGWGSVYKIDVRSGRRGLILWKMDPGTDRAWAGDVACCGVNNRGVALWKDKVISIVLDGRMMALNKETGEVVWERKVADPAIAETITNAPLVVRDFGITGVAGAEFGIRGWVDATDLNTGKQAWRRHTIAGPGEVGFDTWKAPGTWEHGGGSTWVTGAYDPESNLTFWGTGNPGPDWDSEFRPGDNLWASSVIAIDVANGNLKWGFQYTPNDPYDYDEIGQHTIVDARIGNETRKTLVHAARNGFFYVLDRNTGAFVHAGQYVDKVTWTTGIDPKTGRPLQYDPSKAVQVYVPGTVGTRANPRADYCPSISGGTNWQPQSYNPQNGWVYTVSTESCAAIETKLQEPGWRMAGGTVKPRERFTGGGSIPINPYTRYGSLKAIDVATSKVMARVDYKMESWSGTTATAGNLVFAGHQDGYLSAYDSRDLQELWKFNVGTSIEAPVVPYAVDGKQYMAVLVGGRMRAGVISQNPELKHGSTASLLAVFTLN
jgi:alcohol dehydrogenase (cytochrome c)